MPWRIALLLCGAVILFRVVTNRAGPHRLLLGLLLSVSSAARAIGFFWRTIGTDRTGTALDLP